MASLIRGGKTEMDFRDIFGLVTMQAFTLASVELTTAVLNLVFRATVIQVFKFQCPMTVYNRIIISARIQISFILQYRNHHCQEPITNKKTFLRTNNTTKFNWISYIRKI